MSGLDRDRLRALIKARNITPRALSRAVGPNEYLVRDILAGRSRNPRSDTISKLAAQLGVSASELMGVEEPATPFLHGGLTELPLLGPVKAGTWIEQDDLVQAEPPMVTAAADRRYPHARQWVRPVEGDSMTAVGIAPGDLAHVADFAETGLDLATGQIVEVTRYRAGGALREITLKEVELRRDQVLLWPRSNNPAWKDPLVLTDGVEDQEIEVRVTGLLLAAIRVF